MKFVWFFSGELKVFSIHCTTPASCDKNELMYYRNKELEIILVRKITHVSFQEPKGTATLP